MAKEASEAKPGPFRDLSKAELKEQARIEAERDFSEMCKEEEKAVEEGKEGEEGEEEEAVEGSEHIA